MRRFALLSAAASIRTTIVLCPVVILALCFAAWKHQISWPIAFACSGIWVANCFGLIALSATAATVLEKKRTE